MEVPARFVRDYLEAARECGLATHDLLEGLPFTRERLDEPGARVRWNDFAELTDRIGAALGIRFEPLKEICRHCLPFDCTLSKPWTKDKEASVAPTLYGGPSFCHWRPYFSIQSEK